MSKKTLSNKSRYSVLKLSGFRARTATAQGRKTIRNRRKKGRNSIHPAHTLVITIIIRAVRFHGIGIEIDSKFRIGIGIEKFWNRQNRVDS